MTSLSVFQKAILIGITLTTASGVFSLVFPSTANYVFLPGILVVYVLSGGVHGYASGVYLPSLPVWYALGAMVNVLTYSLVAFLSIKRLLRKENGRPL